MWAVLVLFLGPEYGIDGSGAPRVLLGIYLPLIVLAALLAARRMDNLAVGVVVDEQGALAEAARERHTWLLSVLYLATFGSFIGFSFACGPVLQGQFGATPIQAASVSFLGPLLGSLARPLGGKLADGLGGARVTCATFLALAAGTVIVLLASAADQRRSTSVVSPSCSC